MLAILCGVSIVILGQWSCDVNDNMLFVFVVSYSHSHCKSHCFCYLKPGLMNVVFEYHLCE